MASFLYSFWLIWVISIGVIFGDTQSTTFEPRLQWICTPSSMVLTIITDNPFYGIANSKGYRSTCFTTGNGTTETNLIIPLGGRDEQCGVKFDKVMKTYGVEIEVHPHNAIISDLDPVFIVSCNTNSMSYQQKIDYFLELYPLPEATNPTTTKNQATFESPKTTDGKTYILDAFMASIDDVIKYRNHFKMTNCIVESDGTAAVEIIDSNGCSINPNYATNVVYKDEWASVNLTDINPYLKVLKLKCKFSICDENEICRENCDRNWYDSIEKGGKKFVKYIGFGDSSKTAEINDPLLSKAGKKNPAPGVIQKEDEPLPRRTSLLRQLSKRRKAHAKDDEIYATIKSRSSTHRLKVVAPVIYDKPSPKVLPLSQIYENPYITLPSFAKPSKVLERGSSIEENPVYVCQKMPHSGFI
uniref:ZP domain-containing protein n=1 Tax=Panagrolaimus sp. PS1159 TaxID=55785 RepID=A0AC35GW68_9BILA